MARGFARVMAIPLGRPLPAASSNQPGQRSGDGSKDSSAEKRLASPLFGFAPGGACHAAHVAMRAVRSYRTVSPLPCSPRGAQGGFFSVALSFASPRPGVTRHAARSEFGLSSPIARGDHVARSEPQAFYRKSPDPSRPFEGSRPFSTLKGRRRIEARAHVVRFNRQLGPISPGSPDRRSIRSTRRHRPGSPPVSRAPLLPFQTGPRIARASGSWRPPLPIAGRAPGPR